MNRTQATIGSMIPQSLAVLTQPSVSIFERYERGGGVRQAFTYVLLVALISAVISALFALLPFHAVNPLLQFVARLITVLAGFFAFSYAVYFVGRSAFQGTGTFDEVAYTFSLFYVPIAIVTTIVGAFIPLLGWLLSLLNIYFGWLAVQSSMNIRDQGKAIIVLVVAGIVLGLVTTIVSVLIPGY